MAKKHSTKAKARSNTRSNQKILDAFEIAERRENGASSDEEDAPARDEQDEVSVKDGVMDASKFLNNQKRGKDDEEIDSDEALGSDDEFDVLDSKFSQTLRDKQDKKKLRDKRRARGQNVSESEDEEYDSFDESQLVGLSEAWDMDERDKKRAGDSREVVLELSDSEALSASEELSEDSDSESEDYHSASESDDIFKESDNDDINLSSTISTLQNQIQKPKERKRLLNETREENEYNVPIGGPKLSLNDMISAVDSSVSKDAILLDKDPKSKALDTPLPKNIQQKHERRAAYELTKEEVSKWDDTVQQNRQAEVLKFPMNPVVKHNDTATTFRSDNEPSTDLEKKIHGVLEQSALVDDKKEATFEDLAVAQMSAEDLKKRTNELRLMRELMFRDESRAKRIKKIKSKSYRKVQKKQRMKEQALVEGSDESDEDHDRKRAEERMNLKHKTQSGWARSMVKSGLTKDASTREEMEEMLRQGERLRAKQLGYEDGDQSDENLSDLEGEDDGDQSQDESTRKLGKGVLAMDFMKAAEERQKQENRQEMEMLRRMEEGEEEDDVSAVNLVKNQGRRVYTPTAAGQKAEVREREESLREEIEEEESGNLVNRLAAKPKPSDKKAEVYRKTSEPLSSGASKGESKGDSKPEESMESPDSIDANPWLTSSTKKSSKAKTIDQTSSKLSKAANKLKKKNKPTSGALDDEDIDIGQTLDIDVNDSDEEQFAQQDLIQEAFVGDNVVKEFEREKKRIVKEEDDQEEDVSLPGWGDWAGGKKKKRKIVRKIDGITQKDKRKDKNMKNVIINEKVNKKNLKYQSSDVPYPYESREQYERALRMPVGQQWTSRDTHQRLTMPRVITKQGTVIDPLKAPFK